MFGKVHREGSHSRLHGHRIRRGGTSSSRSGITTSRSRGRVQDGRQGLSSYGRHFTQSRLIRSQVGQYNGRASSHYSGTHGPGFIQFTRGRFRRVRRCTIHNGMDSKVRRVYRASPGRLIVVGSSGRGIFSNHFLVNNFARSIYLFDHTKDGNRYKGGNGGYSSSHGYRPTLKSLFIFSNYGRDRRDHCQGSSSHRAIPTS